MAGEKVLLKLSGKIVNPDSPELIERYVQAIIKAVDSGRRIAVVVGGGQQARTYIRCARALGLNNAQADMIGIEIARINALLLAYALGDYAYVPIPRSIEDVQRAWSTGKVVVVGGLQPGQSTAAVAAVVAETLGIRRMLYATDVDGVYDKDPKRFPDAKRFDSISIDVLEQVMSQRFEAGGYELLDPIAVQVIKRSCIEVVVFNGFDSGNFEKILSGEAVGTKIISCR
ncbi:MAG: UMP kinase [Ignisphaera sp.]